MLASLQMFVMPSLVLAACKLSCTGWHRGRKIDRNSQSLEGLFFCHCYKWSLGKYKSGKYILTVTSANSSKRMGKLTSTFFTCQLISPTCWKYLDEFNILELFGLHILINIYTQYESKTVSPSKNSTPICGFANMRWGVGALQTTYTKCVWLCSLKYFKWKNCHYPGIQEKQGRQPLDPGCKQLLPRPWNPFLISNSLLGLSGTCF